MCNRPDNRDQRKVSTLGTHLRGNMDYERKTIHFNDFGQVKINETHARKK